MNTAPYTDIDIANLRIQALERFIHNDGVHRRDLISSTEQSLQWHREETARYRKVASDSTDRLFRQYREHQGFKMALQQIKTIVDIRPLLDNFHNGSIPEAVDSCLDNASSLQTEHTMHEMVDHMTQACQDAGLPVQPK